MTKGRGMIGVLRDLASIPEATGEKHDVVKYYHPDGGSKSEYTDHLGVSLEEAQDICSAPEASYKEGDTSGWWFLGYVRSGSRTKHLTAWRVFSESRKVNNG